MSTSVTAQQIAERIKLRWNSPAVPRRGDGVTEDGIAAGDPSTIITGIATTFVPTLDVLRRAADTGKNLIVTRYMPYWNRTAQALPSDPTARAKKEFIDAHKLVLYRLRDNWDAGTPDRQLVALAKALGWDGHPSQGIYYQLPATTLQALVRNISAQLKIHAPRVLGDPATKIARVALTYGLLHTPELAKVLRESSVDAVIVGEVVEWEAGPYFQDVIASGQKKGLIALGLEASEEPGANAMAAWLKSFISEVPIDWLSAGEPFAAQRWS